MIRDLSDFGPPKSSKINNFRAPSGPTNNSRLTPNSLFCDRIREKALCRQSLSPPLDNFRKLPLAIGGSLMRKL
ncbi:MULTISPECIES: hypothetical protein [unclassified Mesorhizobium]|uniref:hypothetical protein n=1 Tax=unclassified Mesorhizobium TaxID=325217 RepID=UPI0033353495